MQLHLNILVCVPSIVAQIYPVFHLHFYLALYLLNMFFIKNFLVRKSKNNTPKEIFILYFSANSMLMSSIIIPQ